MSDDWNKGYQDGRSGSGPSLDASAAERHANAMGQFHRHSQEQQRWQQERQAQAEQQRRDRERDQERARQSNTYAGGTYQPVRRSTGPGAPFVVWYFGFIGIPFGVGIGPAVGLEWWPLGAFAGFIVGGFLGGFLGTFKIGRIIRWIVGLGVPALIASAIMWPEAFEQSEPPEISDRP